MKIREPNVIQPIHRRQGIDWQVLQHKVYKQISARFKRRDDMFFNFGTRKNIHTNSHPTGNHSVENSHADPEDSKVNMACGKPTTILWVFPKIGVSQNGVYNGKPYQNGWFGGTSIFGNIHIPIGEDLFYINRLLRKSKKSRANCCGAQKRTSDLQFEPDLDSYPTISSWWFQPSWKILFKLDHFPK